MELRYLTKDAIEDIKTNFPLIHRHYSDSTNEWFLSRFAKANQLLDSNIVVKDINFCFDDNLAVSDKKNVIEVHTALLGLTPSQASDERIWAALSHTDAWDFIQYRRKKESDTPNEQNLKSWYFFNSGAKRSCYVNRIAKYWWCGHMLYDSSAQEPYAALDVVCNTTYFLSLVVLLSSSNFTACKNVTLGYIDSFRAYLQSGKPLTRNQFQDVLAYLNKKASVLILDMLSREEICAICTKRLNEIA